LTLAELAEEAGVPARTIRYYIARGLVPGPSTAGRGASYGAEHLDRLAAIRKLQNQGRTLSEVARALGGEPRDGALPEPSAWWHHPVAPDVVVLVKSDAAPWRLRQIRGAVEQMAAQLGPSGQSSPKGGNDGDR
jgi:DNA-binding transcriptional MerR regulator